MIYVNTKVGTFELEDLDGRTMAIKTIDEKDVRLVVAIDNHNQDIFILKEIYK